LKLVDGMGRGTAVFHQPRVVVEHTVADDIEVERQRVYSAFARMREQIDTMMGQAEFVGGGDHHDVLETYKMFAYDEGWSRRINEAIDTGLTAEAAIERVQARTRARMRSIEDPYLRERLTDLDDLSNRLQRIVSGQLGTAAASGLRGDTILIARNLGPAELLEYDKRFLKGVVLEEGSLTAHVIIVARAMGVPERRIVWHLAFRNALIPVLAVIGVTFAWSLGNAILVEAVFSRPGLGSTILKAIMSRDYQLVQAGVLVLAAAVVLLNTALDLIYGAIDPRLRRT
jgi:signal transduction protein with GAF and PtsI domain